MKKRAIVNTVAGVGIIAAAIIPSALPASAITFREGEYVTGVRVNSNQDSPYTDAALIAAGRYACERRAHYRIGTQFGFVKKRLEEAVMGEVNRNRFGNSRANLSRAVVTYSTWTPVYTPFGSLC